MDFNDPEQVKWACEQIGVDYKGLPLTHFQKQRFISLSQKYNLTYVPPTRRPSMAPNRPFVPTITQANALSSELTENALLGQYDRELKSLEERSANLHSQIKDIENKKRALAKKRAAVAKIVAAP